ncbi:sigma factor-like helix-turn-helix DNA-binding protein [Corynebacterium glutamicum]|uniref:RNA polymerase sigma factor 70 region 4 type 2 domain-containing protein n=1 Tax=Corynebacterium glutamicum (strain R) TaxID=340322 RepID=A0AB72VGF0_CORGB|nr:sigma factor-like helix-turn-helix DNA-binding protein [Corynebacterium glutamicum]BAF56019.1 hypothetical protein cgR_p0006 [Corynebacterium glutamicum R]
MARLHRDIEQIENTDRAVKARSLRLTGFTYREIAKKLDVSISTVQRDLERIKVDYPRQTVMQLVEEQNDKIVELMKVPYMKGVRGDFKAIETFLKLADHQAKLYSAYGSQADDSGMDMAMKQFDRLVQAIQDGAKEDHPGDH